MHGRLRRAVLARRGLCGQATSDTGPVKVTYDNSPPDGSRGCSSGSSRARRPATSLGMSQAERRREVLDSFARYFGDRAASPSAYLDKSWAEGGVDPRLLRRLHATGRWTGYGRRCARPSADPLGRHRDGDDLERLHGRRRAVGRARRGGGAFRAVRRSGAKPSRAAVEAPDVRRSEAAPRRRWGVQVRRGGLAVVAAALVAALYGQAGGRLPLHPGAPRRTDLQRQAAIRREHDARFRTLQSGASCSSST